MLEVEIKSGDEVSNGLLDGLKHECAVCAGLKFVRREDSSVFGEMEYLLIQLSPQAL